MLTSSLGAFTLVVMVLVQLASQVTPPPETLAVFCTGEATALAIATCALITWALEPGSSTALLVQLSCAAVLAVQSQPLAVTGNWMLMPTGMLSLTVIAALVLLVPLLLTMME